MMTLQSANAQKEDDYIGLLIECYRFLYAPESIVELVETEEIGTFHCIERPGNFYEDFSDTRIGFEFRNTSVGI